MTTLQDTKLVYKHFATLYFVFVIDSAESELGILDLIQGMLSECRSRILILVVYFAQSETSFNLSICDSYKESFLSEILFWDLAVFVETLDRCFKNVCELDIVYNFNKVDMPFVYV